MEGTAASQAAEGADLVVFPEGVMHDFSAGVDLYEVAEPLDGRFVSSLAGIAHRNGVAVAAGCWERPDEVDDRRVFNTVVVAGADGARLAIYRKIHLFDSFGFDESARVRSGAIDPVVFDLAGFRVGVMTCYDLRFPELARRLVDRGAELIIVPSGWIAGDHKLEHWVTLIMARAIENTVYVAASGLSGGRFVGHSAIVDPMGVVVAQLGADPGEASAEVDPVRLSEVRRLLPSIRHRRM